MTKGKSILIFSTITIVGLFFLFLGLTKAKPFLAPFVTAIILALLMLPLARKLENGIFSRSVSSLINTILLFLVSLGFMALFSFQVKSLVDDWPQIKETMQPKITKVKEFVFEHSPISPESLETSKPAILPNSSGTTSGSSPSKKAASFFSMVVGFLGTYLLTFIYIFFMLTYRHRFKEFLIMIFPDRKKEDVKSVVEKSAGVAQKYLIGKLILIGILAVLYSIGLGISGVNNFILVSVIAAIFSLIPYIGNIIGLGMALAFGYLTSGDSMVLVGILLTFTIAQFVESYILEPYVVGDKVELHPFIIIIAVIIGNMVWGIIGMILAIPIVGILTVIFNHIPVLYPFGFLFSNKDKLKDSEK